MKEIFAIYRSPKDYPGLYVVRGHLCFPDGTSTASLECETARTLERARSLIPAGLYHLMPPLEGDVRSLVEVWIRIEAEAQDGLEIENREGTPAFFGSDAATSL